MEWKPVTDKKVKKTEIEELVDLIYHRQTYGKDCSKLIEKLKHLTNK
jgi:hypothetical protein